MNKKHEWESLKWEIEELITKNKLVSYEEDVFCSLHDFGGAKKLQCNFENYNYRDYSEANVINIEQWNNMSYDEKKTFIKNELIVKKIIFINLSVDKK